MTLRWLVRPNTYHDSIALMRISEALAGEQGVVRAAAVMATPLNVELLAADGLLPPAVPATADDLLVTVLGADEAAAAAALARVDELLAPRDVSGAERAPFRTLARAAAVTASNLAIVAVPGPLAALEAYDALRAGLHVFLFSDNVPIEEEVRLKALAAERDLLLMGPDCGTAILDGVGLGFANRVLPGPAGIVGASGTGIQQVCCLLDEAGIGIAQAVGAGGRDLSAAVGGAMTRRALRLLDADDGVEVILLISKPPHTAVARQLHDDLRSLRTPSVACLLGARDRDEGSVRYASTLTEAAEVAARILGKPAGVPPSEVEAPRRHASFRSYAYGLFAGGTLRDEAAQILLAAGVPHRLVDLGGDEYTRGRAHPMIDGRLRASILADVGRHDDAGALLLDVILGDLAHPDPAGALLPALHDLRAYSDLPVFATLVGTRRDPQGLERQRAALAAAGVQVFSSNARAAESAAAAVGGDA